MIGEPRRGGGRGGQDGPGAGLGNLRRLEAAGECGAVWIREGPGCGVESVCKYAVHP